MLRWIRKFVNTLKEICWLFCRSRDNHFTNDAYFVGFLCCLAKVGIQIRFLVCRRDELVLFQYAPALQNRILRFSKGKTGPQSILVSFPKINGMQQIEIATLPSEFGCRRRQIGSFAESEIVGTPEGGLVECSSTSITCLWARPRRNRRCSSWAVAFASHKFDLIGNFDERSHQC